jgi:hypothetical protein
VAPLRTTLGVRFPRNYPPKVDAITTSSATLGGPRHGRRITAPVTGAARPGLMGIVAAKHLLPSSHPRWTEGGPGAHRVETRTTQEADIVANHHAAHARRRRSDRRGASTGDTSPAMSGFYRPLRGYHACWSTVIGSPVAARAAVLSASAGREPSEARA